MGQDIRTLDRNFVQPTAEDGLRWLDVREWPIEGQGWPTESAPFTRLPDRAEAVVSEPVWMLSRRSTGLCVRFESNASTIAARWKLRFPNLALAHMPATGVSGLDLYVWHEGRWRWLAVGIPDGPLVEKTLVQDLPAGRRQYLLYLPLYNGVESVELGVPKGATLDAAPPRNPRDPRPICFYGTSIVQGGCAARPGCAYPAILGRRLDQPHLNLGFSGNGKCEDEVAHLLAEQDACAFVLDPLPNLPPDQVDIEERILNLARTLRRARPRTPIVLVESITYQNAFLVELRRQRFDSANAALQRAHAQLKQEIGADLHYLPGDRLLGKDGEATVDGTHPTDLGFFRMADALEPILRQILDRV